MKEKAVSVGLIGLMLSVGFVGLVAVVPGPVAATTELFYSDGGLDGYVFGYDATYPPAPTTVEDAGTLLCVGQNYWEGSYAVRRAFVSFDTSSMPENAVVQSVVLRLYLKSDYSTVDFNLEVYESDYGSLEVSDWDVMGAYQGTMFNTSLVSADSWYSMSISAGVINETGYSGFLLASDREVDEVTPEWPEYIWLNSGDSTQAPELQVVYLTTDSTIRIQTDGGYWYDSSAYPVVSEWNLTHDLYYHEIDTVPNTKNMTISKEANWTFLSIVPECNYTDNGTYIDFSDVLDSTTYRLWFTAPKVSPYCTAHIALYNAFTGEGFFWEQMRVSICNGTEWDSNNAETVPVPDYRVESNEYYTLMVSDYFGNELVNQSFLASAQDVYLRIPVPLYSWQVFNMNEMPVLMKIYWEGAGAPWEFFVGPQWIVERFLKGGDYTFMVTFYDASGIVGETVYYERTVPSTGVNASFVMVNGTTLSEVVTDIEGLQATQEIITSLVSPSLVLVYEDLPMAPTNLRTLSLAESLAIDPYLVLEATTYQNDSGADMEFWLPHPETTGATYYIQSDVLSFAGTYATSYWVNTTDSEELYSGATLPATLLLDGENITVETTAAVSASRATTWREVSEYMVTYYPTEKRYSSTISLNNSLAFDYYSPYWFIGFPTNTTIALDSVVVYDLDNGIYLSQTAHFTVTSGGVHLTLSRLNSSEARNFRITYYDYNSTDWIGAPNLVAYSYTTASYNGVPMKFTAVQWGNPWSIAYRGEIYITLNFTNGEYLRESSIKVVNQVTGRLLSDSEWIYTGRTIIVLTSGVGTVPVGGSMNIGIYWTFDAAEAEDRTDFFFGPIVYSGKQFYLGGFAVSWAFIVILVGWVVVGYSLYSDKKDWQAHAIIWGCVTIILFLVGHQVT